jgi:hypothetical protein
MTPSGPAGQKLALRLYVMAFLGLQVPSQQLWRKGSMSPFWDYKNLGVAMRAEPPSMLTRKNGHRHSNNKDWERGLGFQSKRQRRISRIPRSWHDPFPRGVGQGFRRCSDYKSMTPCLSIFFHRRSTHLTLFTEIFATTFPLSSQDTLQ